MSKFQRPETLVVFNGQDADGRKMSYENQFRTFRSATLVLGPHGSGRYTFSLPFTFGAYVCAHPLPSLPVPSPSGLPKYNPSLPVRLSPETGAGPQAWPTCCGCAPPMERPAPTRPRCSSLSLMMTRPELAYK